MSIVNIIDFVYLISAVLFMLGIKNLSSPATAKLGNKLSMAGMLVAIAATLASPDMFGYTMIIIAIAIGAAIGGYAAVKVEMTSMPEMVALFNGCGGAASALVAMAEFNGHTGAFANFTMITLLLSVIIGGLTFTGSIIAYTKLQGIISTRPITYPFQQVVNAGIVLLTIFLAYLVFQNPANTLAFYFIILLALGLGVLAVIPIGGADMPVIVSLLNSYSGLAVSMTGFALNNNALIIVGSLVGASGLFLTKIMCDAMNRSLANVLFGAFGAVDDSVADGGEGPTGSMKGFEVEDVAITLQNADSLIIVPGYGMAAAQAQHVTRELGDYLGEEGVDVRYAIHSVAGRMPGHMNVLLAEADVPYDQLYAMEDINDDFSTTDVVLVIGANDVVNPAAKTNPGSPIYGMPILEVDKAQTVVVLKRSMNVGFAGIENELFFKDNTMMLFGDAKSSIQKLLSAVKE
ncbi:NAD/NADP transhydrogenase beta subunit [Desulfocapsa sulfexigens DSM 10523]|uniref:NAD(P) transhydrogenase subunit beta n=1 Tax=Desulfocapsa sulfexigens (strain DSM 10523 / SB164P1) TaxID=1167006 RepID=M1PQT5_DESSD|nr:NAD(P)(+) transhydrogenase (Re/Si-specific) subunit beta [Desulfocapsa sulfexigens]AGF78761.1 NAD/NADP transhydrogenase beta subunit [Desulfocapsa sulfexigens DSM 10523]